MASIRGLLKPCYVFAPKTILRRVLHELFPRKAETALVALPWGISIEVDLSDAIGREIFKQRSFDVAVSEAAWRLLQSGNKVLDIGANIGYLTSLFAVRAGQSGKVHAFEPHPEVARKLARNIARIGLRPAGATVVQHDCALGSVTGQAQLVETDYFQINRGTARIAEGNTEAEIRSHAVRMETLDHLFPTESFDLAKIDVEGFERRVLEGGQNLLQSRRIRHIIYEDHTVASGSIADMLKTHGYSVFSIGYSLWGPKLRGLDQQLALDRAWESPSFLATIEPDHAMRVMRGFGWRAL